MLVPASTAHDMACALETRESGEGLSIPGSWESVNPRRIEFHLAQKPLRPFLGKSESDFQVETLNPTSDAQGHASDASGPSDITGKKPDAGGGDLFEHGLDPELRFEITFRRIGAGLANLGNTCFLNSVLQCLTYTEPLAAYLQSGKHKSSCHIAGFCVLCAIQNHVRSALQSTGKILSPLHLVKNLRCISRNFRNSRQEDAHEYMVNLLESMHKCCLPSGVSSESPSAYEKSLVHKIFGGRLRSQVRCTQCSYSSNKFDPFLDLSLEIFKADSLRKALAHFTAKEQLDGGEKQYQCQRCKEKVKALKQLTVDKAPYVLTIHLKRFGPDIPGQKIDKWVEFGCGLDLKPFVSGPYEGDLKYTLYGVLVHAGWSTHSGHYYCFVRTSSGMWYSLDDNRVFQVSERIVLEQKAYMLFYVRNRNKIVQKKPIEVTHGETMTSNTLGSKEIPVSFSGLKEAIADAQIATGLNAFKCASLTDALAISSHHHSSSSPKSSLKQSVVMDTSDHLSAEHTVTEDPLKPTLSGKPNLGLSLESSTLKKLSGSYEGTVPKLATMGNGRVTSLSVDSRINVGVESRACDQDSQRSGKDSSILVVEHCSNGPQNSSKNITVEDGMHENVITMNGTIPTNSTCKLRGRKYEEIGAIESSCAVDSFVHENSSIQQDDGIQNAEHSPNLWRQKNIGDNDLLLEPEAKRNKHMKFHAVKSMLMGPKRLFLASMCLQKKKLKRRNRHRLPMKMRIGRDILTCSASDDPGTSTSENYGMVSHLKKRKKHRRHCALEKESASRVSMSDCNHNIGTSGTKERGPEERPSGHFPMNADDHRMKKRGVSMSDSDQNISTSVAKERVPEEQPSLHFPMNADGHQMKKRKLSMSDSSQNISTSGTKERAPEEQPSLHFPMKADEHRMKKRSYSAETKSDNVVNELPNQHNIVSMLVRGLDMPAVSRWDGGESRSSEVFGMGSAQNGSIGYVLDDWDEDYDRGKRKKIKKSVDLFAGHNPFQEIATKRVHKKMKARMGQRRAAGDQPFRI